MTHSTIAERSLQWLLASATDAMLIIDKEGQLLLVNPALETLFGYQPGELLGKSLESLIPERFRHGHVGLRGSYFEHPHPRAS